MIHRLVPVVGAALLLASCGGGGGDDAPPPAADSTPPDTTLAGAPLPLTNGTSVQFTFASTETATFEARLDGAAFAAATSPVTFNNLADGNHVFEVRARDAAGNLDATPASATWTIDSTPPDTQITAAPSSTAVVSSSTFTFAATEAGSTLEVSVDAGPYGAQVSPLAISGLADGNHTISIRARDAAGNVDATPATASWSLDASAPQVRLQFPTQTSYTDSATLTVRGTASDPAGIAALSVNGVAAQTTDNFAHWRAVIPVQTISNEIRTTSRDGLGNEAPAILGSIINRGPLVNRPMGIAFDAPRDRFIVVDGTADAILAVRRLDGVASVVSAGSVPGTPGTPGFQDLVIDAANDRALVVATVADQLVAVNLATGARSLVSAGAGPGSPTTLTNASNLTLDATGQNVYVTEVGANSVLRIALATGARTVVSGQGVGVGLNADLNVPRGIVYDNVTNPTAPRLLVASSNSTPTGVIAIDIATGNRARFSMGTTGSGPAFVWAHGLALDAANQRLLVSDSNNAIVAVALADGARTPLNITSPPTPTALQSFGHLAFDSVTRHVYLTQTNGSILDIDTTARSSSMIAGSSLPNLNGTYLGMNGLAIEQASGGATSLITLFGGTLAQIARVNLAQRTAEIVSAEGIGSGPPLDTAVDFALDRANNRAFVTLGLPASNRLIASVDLATGNRAVVVDNASGNLDSPSRLAHDAINNRLVFLRLDPSTMDVELDSIDLATRNIVPISDASATGPSLDGAAQIVLEPAANPTRALLADYTSNRVLGVNLATGARTVFGTLPSGFAGSLYVDGASSRLFVANHMAPSALMTAPLAGGGMWQLISGIDPVSGVMRGTGPPQHIVERFEVDVANGVAYAMSHGNVSLLAIDVVSGDRVVVAR